MAVSHNFDSIVWTKQIFQLFVPESDVNYYLTLFYDYLEQSKKTGVNVENIGLYLGSHIFGRIQLERDPITGLRKLLISDLITIAQFLLLIDPKIFNATLWVFLVDFGEFLDVSTSNTFPSHVKAVGFGGISSLLMNELESQVSAQITYLIQQDPDSLSYFQKLVLRFKGEDENLEL